MPPRTRAVPVDASMATALAASLKALDPDPRDAAAVQLARKLAEDIDRFGDLSRSGPALLKTLEQLGATPLARSASRGGTPSAKSPAASAAGKADELRERRARLRSG